MCEKRLERPRHLPDMAIDHNRCCASPMDRHWALSWAPAPAAGGCAMASPPHGDSAAVRPRVDDSMDATWVGGGAADER